MTMQPPFADTRPHQVGAVSLSQTDSPQTRNEKLARIVLDGATVGVVTSGTHTPFLKKAIGMAYVPPALAAVGTEFTIDIRGRQARAVVVPMPFYKRPKA